ncbi:hypothetical protein MIND_01134200 [Mycena indigotica]|uniref:Uncharacterized protein n=1 Tax=Mycena indigotica TaxID=2126181 RepID=A0A8H6S706_9AGAR|nr:uncharacterized protein MIND_01134200 [Mycena indigotica]KAF7293557.1 hypothetical protein MIND_01134200 [Mycena indigotica]
MFNKSTTNQPNICTSYLRATTLACIRRKTSGTSSMLLSPITALGLFRLVQPSRMGAPIKDKVKAFVHSPSFNLSWAQARGIQAGINNQPPATGNYYPACRT